MGPARPRAGVGLRGEALNPKEARTAAELFGEAMGDPRALKRAYARLIREHGPETDPEAFQHIRALYEAALAAPAAEAEAAPSSPVDALLAGWETDPDETLRALGQLAEEGDDRAAEAAVGLAAALRPDRVESLLDALFALPRRQPVAVRLAQAVLHFDAGLLPPEAPTRWVAGCVERGAATRLSAFHIDLLLDRARLAEAWSAWTTYEAMLATAAPEIWTQAFFRVFCTAGFDVVPLDPWWERIHDARLGLSEEAHEAAIRLLCVLEAWRTSTADPAMLPVTAHIRAASSFDGVATTLALVALAAEPGRREALGHATHVHPGLVGFLARRLDQVTRRNPTLWAADRGEAVPVPELPVAALAGLLQGEIAAERIRRARDAEELAWQKRRSIHQLALVFSLAAAIVGFGTFGGDMSPILGWTFLIAVVVPAVWSQRRLGLRVGQLEAEGRPPWAEAEAARAAELLARAVPFCREHALWLHEVAFGATGAAPIDDLLADPLSDLEVISTAHLRRGISWRSG